MIARWLIAALAACTLAGAAPARPALPEGFDPIGTPVSTLTPPHGDAIHYTDTAEPGFTPLVLVGGAGTSARAGELVGFLTRLRTALHVRLIVVERNGFGDTPFRPDWTFADYTAQVSAVLDHLHIARFHLAAISGGGAYAGHIAAAMPARVLSLHFAAAVASLATDPECSQPADALATALAPVVGNPEAWWHLPPDGVTAHIPAFATRAADEGARAFFIAGQHGDARGIAAEMLRLCAAAPSLAAVRAPTFLYYGLADHTVGEAQGALWAASLPQPPVWRRYPGEGHDVQYRHWDQLLVDVALGRGTLVCRRGRSSVVAIVRAGDSLGVCAWR